MTRFLFGLLLLGGIGCTQMQPIGPLAKVTGTPRGEPTPAADADTALPAPAPTAALKPAPPAVLITEAEVTTADPSAAIQKLTDELKYDQKTALPPPRTAEISVIKGGVKQ